MFNCAIVAKDGANNFKFVRDTDDELVFMYRRTPTNFATNDIMIAEYDISANDIGRIYPVVTNGKIGSYEDARFFTYQNRLGITYTYKMTMGASFLDDEYNIVEHDIIPFADYFPAPEKNWIFVEKVGRLFALRFYCPLEVYEVDLINKRFTPHVKWNWKYPGASLRGGTPPVLRNGKYYMMLHSAQTYHMYMLVVDAATFMPLQISSTSLIRNIPTKFQFPCGMVYDCKTEEWIVSLGIDDLKSAIVRFSEEALQLVSVAAPSKDTYFEKIQLRKQRAFSPPPPPSEIQLLTQEIQLLRKEVCNIKEKLVYSSQPPLGNSS